MEILAWLWWGLSTALGLALSLVWFLLGGWVATLAQIAVAALVVFGYKYGWQRAPFELAARLAGAGRFLWAWMRAREPAAVPARAERRARREGKSRHR